jgi:HSP20 family protein
MLMRTDPFRQFERLTQEALGTRMRPAFMPMDAYRSGDHFVVHLDIPGVEASSIDLTVEKGTLTVTAERQWRPSDADQVLASERPQGTFSRQLLLGDGLDTERVDASYDNGVLTIRVPVAEQAKARKVEVSAGGGKTAIGQRSEAA